MKLDFEWQDAPGVRDKVLAATWSRLTLTIDDQCASEAIDLRSNSRRTGIYGSLFPLAAWIVEQWWQLLNEPSPSPSVPLARASSPDVRGWVRRHSLLAARDGGALPDLTIVRDGGDIFLKWEPDPAGLSTSRVRFVGQGTARVKAEEFERRLSDFVDAVLARLSEQLSNNEEVKRLSEAWNAIRSADSQERELCESLAIVGVDPYDPGAATRELVATVQRCVQRLPAALRTDLLEGSTADSLNADLSWVERECANLGQPRIVASPSIDLTLRPSAHETGYLAADRVRSELLQVRVDAPIQDLQSALVDRLGWSSDLMKIIPDTDRIQGMVRLDPAKSAPMLVASTSRGMNSERFRLARAAFFPVTKSLSGGARLLTDALTRPQRASRAFAAELLAPAAALKKHVRGRVTDQVVEQLATEFSVSALVIAHQIENHGLGYLES